MSGTVNGAMIGLGFGAEFIPIYSAHPSANITAICRRNEAELLRAHVDGIPDMVGVLALADQQRPGLADFVGKGARVAKRQHHRRGLVF